MANSIESKLEKLRSLCLVLGEDFENLLQKELDAPPDNHHYSMKLDLLLERRSDLKSFRLTQVFMFTLKIIKRSQKMPLFADDGDEDPVASLRSVTAQIEEMKNQISSRGSIVTRAVIALNAVDEVKWFRRYSYRAQALSDANHDMHGRAVKAQKLSLKIIGMLNGLEDKVDDWETAERKRFNYNGVELMLTIDVLRRELSMPPEVVHLQLHPAHREYPDVQIDLQPQQFDAPAEDEVVPPPHNPAEDEIILLPLHPIDLNVPRRVRTPRVPVEAAPDGPPQPALAHEPHHSTSDSNSHSEDGDDSDDPDYVP
uniref:Uncharacterized protein n=1 Tax=Oryza punctata TaxID=4537 RepID=A0A0E0L551_ORYPU